MQVVRVLEARKVMHRRYDNPRGRRLRALEQNVLRYRAMDMILALFRAERLRTTIISCVTDRSGLMKKLDVAGQSNRLGPGTKNPLQKALGILVKDGVFTEAERREIESLVDYRNDIAHRLENLVGDIGATSLSRDFLKFRQSKTGRAYDYRAVEKLEKFQKLLYDRGRSKYVWEISFTPILFDGAEFALKTGLKRLRKKIDRQVATRKEENHKLNRHFSLDREFANEFDPYHPHNQYENGNLTERGVEVCYRLFDVDKPPIAVAHMMRLSLRATSKRFKMWKAAGGKRRKTVDFSKLPIRKFYTRED
jgi:hypothetical protein